MYINKLCIVVQKKNGKYEQHHESQHKTNENRERKKKRYVADL